MTTQEQTTEEIIKKGEKIKKKSLKSVTRSKKMLLESIETASTTMVKLQEQTEHMDRVNRQNEEVRVNLEHGKETIGKINGFWGRVGDKFRRKKKEEKKDEKKEEKVKSPSTEKKEDKELTKTQSQALPITEQLIPEPQIPAGPNPHHDQVDDELEELHSMVKGLKQMAIDAGGEINRQSQKIDEMSDRIGGNQDQLHCNMKKVHKML